MIGVRAFLPMDNLSRLDYSTAWRLVQS
jgi:hypothetical protein